MGLSLIIFLLMLPVVAIVGRPNVGKSSLFNRILGRKAAVVDDFSGVTRDRHYKPAAWEGQNFLLVDTGGMVPSEREMLNASINHQIRIAVKEAAAVILVAEAGCGITAEDEHIAKLLRKEAADRVFLVVNKVESARKRYEIDAYRNLGLGDPFPVSALHGSGVADLLDAVVLLLKRSGLTVRRPGEAAPQTLRVAVVGRPNAGKSSMVNKLLGDNRMIVDDVPGTTRDSIDSEMTYQDRPVLLIDTAGLRKKSHVKYNIEYFFNLRALAAIGRCDVCVVVVDTNEGIGVQDLRIVSRVFEQHRGIVLAWNKWDLVSKKHDTFDKMVARVKERYLELRPVPMVSVSALTGQRVTRVLDEAFAIRDRLAVRVPAAEFEDLVFTWVRAHPHPAIPSDPVRFLGARQANAPWPSFTFFTTNPGAVMPAYVRFLTNKIYDTYGFAGCPVTLQFRAAAHTRRGHPFKPGRIKEEV